MIRSFITIICLQFLLIGLCSAQEIKEHSFSLEECIELAITNSLDIQGANLATQTSTINLSQSKSDQLPTLNFDYNLGRTNGRSIDPFSNDVVTEGLNFSYAGLNLEANIFNGFRLKNLIKQNEQNVEAAEMQKQTVKEMLILDVTLAYLQVLNNRDLLEISKVSLKTTKVQLTRLQVLYEKEVGNPAEYFDMKAQVSLEKLNIENLESMLSNAFISLATLMNIDVSDLNNIAPLELEKNPEPFSFSATDIYKEAIQHLSQVKASELEKEAIYAGISIEKSGCFPSLSFFGRLNTNYSSAAQLFTENGTTIEDTDNFIQLNNSNIPVLKNATLFESSKIGYFTQLQNNLNSSFGFAVRIPILNGFVTKNNIAIQKIMVEEKELEIQSIKRRLKQSIEIAFLNMKTAYNRYQILAEQIIDLKESFRVNEIRFNNGLSNTVAYLMSKNNLDNALKNLIATAHDYELRKRVLAYYRGRME